MNGESHANDLCPPDPASGYPDTGAHITLGVPVRVFLDEVSV